MKEVPPTKEAIFSFRGQPSIEETEWGEKYTFPITLHSHPSYPLLEDGPIEMEWQSKCSAAKQLFLQIMNPTLNEDETWSKKLEKAYQKSKWQLTRFDNGAYFLTVV